MKRMLFALLILITIMLLAPLTAMKKTSEPINADVKLKIPVSEGEDKSKESFRVLDTSDDSISDVKCEDYIFGVVAAEMPALYDEEALKAQAVASYTYALRRKAENSEKKYDITNDETTDQCYITEEKARERWGEQADTYVKKIKDAIESVYGVIVTYDDEPALTVYHAISGGKTESAKNVWGKDYPYLCPVSSEGDTLSPNYISTLSISESDFSDKISSVCKLSGEPKDYFSDIKKSDSGNVLELRICGTEVRGARIRSVFNLKSTNFDITYADGSFTFTCYGYGHGVGMSQYGADYMAKQGSDYKEILSHYYVGCKLEKR